MKKQLKAPKQRAKKKELEYEFIFAAANNQKIVLQRYAEESIVWWDQGQRKKVWKGDNSICEASDFVRNKWPKRRMIYSNASYNPPPRPADVRP